MTCALECRIAVLGGGCVGSSIAQALALAGQTEVVLVDQGRRTASATSRSHGMVRVFHEDPRHVELALENHRALRAYQRLGILSDAAAPNGSLYFFSRARRRSFEAALHAMQQHGYPFELLSAREGRLQFPDFHWSEDDLAVYEPLGGHRSPETFVDELLGDATRRGVQVLDSFEVRHIAQANGRYVLKSEGKTVAASALVLAGGARMLPRLGDLGLTLPLTARRLVAYLADGEDTAPRLPNYFDRETLEFARFGGGAQVALSEPRPRRMPGRCWRAPLRRRVGTDCYAPDRAGLLGRAPGHPRVFVATGWGGTAFKFALEVGRRVSRMVTDV